MPPARRRTVLGLCLDPVTPTRNPRVVQHANPVDAPKHHKLPIPIVKHGRGRLSLVRYRNIFLFRQPTRFPPGSARYLDPKQGLLVAELKEAGRGFQTPDDETEVDSHLVPRTVPYRPEHLVHLLRHIDEDLLIHRCGRDH